MSNMSNEKTLREELRQGLAQLPKAEPKSEEYMTAAQQQLFKTFLVSFGRLLDSRAVDIKKQIQGNKPDGADEADKAQAQTNLESNYQREFAIAQQQRNVRAAFESMRNDEYGYCVDCGAEIGMDRMLSMPWSIRDADCAELFELKDKQINGRSAA